MDTTTSIHLVRGIIGLVSFCIAGIALARGTSSTGVWRWGPWGTAAYAYAICAVELIEWNTRLNIAVWFTAAATASGLVYVYTIIKSWRHPECEARVKPAHYDVASRIIDEDL